MRQIALLVLMVAIGCSGQPKEKPQGANQPAPDPQAAQNLKTQAEEVGRTVKDLDHARLAELTHPAIVQHFGGRAGFIKQVGGMASEMQKSGYQLQEYTVGEPGKLVSSGGHWYAVVPTQIEMKGPRGERGTLSAFLVGISQDGGIHWQFLDGNGVVSDRVMMKRLIPTFPTYLSLPVLQEPVWEKK